MCDGDGFMGGAGGPCYNTPLNTMGVGDVVPPVPGRYGSGDLFPILKMGIATKRGAFYGGQPKRKRQPKSSGNSGFVTKGTNDGSSMNMQPRPLYVPLKKK